MRKKVAGVSGHYECPDCPGNGVFTEYVTEWHEYTLDNQGHIIKDFVDEEIVRGCKCTMCGEDADWIHTEVP